MGRVGSTSDEVRTLARAGAAHGTAVCAAAQDAGRGRLGRPWVSAPGNLYLSVLLRVATPAVRLPELAFVAGLAVADAVDGCLPQACRAQLKWPNDVLVGGAKIAGILLEATKTTGGPYFVILGIGVNVGHAPAGLPYAATYLGAHSAADLDRVLEGVLAGIAARWDQWRSQGFGVVRADWGVRGPQVGARLRVSQPGGAVEGAFLDLAADGSLLLDTLAGPRRFIGGDVG